MGQTLNLNPFCHTWQQSVSSSSSSGRASLLLPAQQSNSSNITLSATHGSGQCYVHTVQEGLSCSCLHISQIVKSKPFLSHMETVNISLMQLGRALFSVATCKAVTQLKCSTLYVTNNSSWCLPLPCDSGTPLM